eukprot:6880724-Prymnesium_polylepis.1
MDMDMDMDMDMGHGHGHGHGDGDGDGDGTWRWDMEMGYGGGDLDIWTWTWDSSDPRRARGRRARTCTLLITSSANASHISRRLADACANSSPAPAAAAAAAESAPAARCCICSSERSVAMKFDSWRTASSSAHRKASAPSASNFGAHEDLADLQLVLRWRVLEALCEALVVQLPRDARADHVAPRMPSARRHQREHRSELALDHGTHAGAVAVAPDERGRRVVGVEHLEQRVRRVVGGARRCGAGGCVGHDDLADLGEEVDNARHEDQLEQ